MGKSAAPSGDFFCTKPWTSFQIDDHKGNVNTCCWSTIKCGNINKSTIEEIWNGPGFVHVRHSIAAGNPTLVCSPDCPYRLGEFVEEEEALQATTEDCLSNWLLQRKEIASRELVLKSKPTLMRVVPTLTCNLDCVMCFQDRHDRVHLPKNIQQILSEYFPVLQELLVLGGEPLVSPKCLRIMESIDPCRYPDLHLALITNGTAVTEKIERLLLHRHISWILVSVDAASPETYRKIRGGQLRDVVAGVQRLNTIRETQATKWRLLIGFTLMRSNQHEARQFVDLADSLGVEPVFTPIFGDWHDEHFRTVPTELDQLEETIAELEDYLVSKGQKKIKVARLKLMLAELRNSR